MDEAGAAVAADSGWAPAPPIVPTAPASHRDESLALHAPTYQLKPSSSEQYVGSSRP